MSLIMWLKEPGRRGKLLARLYGESAEEAREALAGLRERGWLEDGSLRGVDLREANLPGADLSEADLEEAWFEEADLHGADFTNAALADADFTNADLHQAVFHEASLYETLCYDSNLRDTDLREANLRRADLTLANLRGAKLDGAFMEYSRLRGAEVDEGQLARACMLVDATMPDGSAYDGRFNLPGDLEQAEQECFDLESDGDMADFYGVSVEDYRAGQEWARAHPEHLQAKAREAGVEDRMDTAPDEERGAFRPLRPNNPPDYVRLVLWAFDDPDRLWECRDEGDNRRTFRLMGAWMVSLLVWLPVLVHNVMLNVYVQLQSPALPSGITPLLAIFSLGIGMVGFVSTSLSGRQRAREGKVGRAVAIFTAIMFSYGGFPWAGVVVLVGYLLALVTALRVVGRASRVTIFWVASLSAAAYMGSALGYYVPYDYWGLSKDVAGVIRATAIWGRYLVAVALIWGLQSSVKSRLLKWLEQRNSDLLGIVLLVAYLLSVGMLIRYMIIDTQ